MRSQRITQMILQIEKRSLRFIKKSMKKTQMNLLETKRKSLSPQKELKGKQQITMRMKNLEATYKMNMNFNELTFKSQC